MFFSVSTETLSLRIQRDYSGQTMKIKIFRLLLKDRRASGNLRKLYGSVGQLQTALRPDGEHAVSVWQLDVTPQPAHRVSLEKSYS